MKQRKGKTMFLPAKSKTKPRPKAKLKLASNSRFSIKRMLPFLLVFAVVGTIMLWRSFATDGYQLQDINAQNPAISRQVTANSVSIAEQGEVSALLYLDTNAADAWIYFNNVATGVNSHVKLPQDPNYGFAGAKVVWSNPTELWVAGGGGITGGNIYVHQYQLSGSPLPTNATLVSSQAFGDHDSRPGDLIKLASGALVVAWHQQGQDGGLQGQFYAYRSPLGTWSSATKIPYFMPTNASTQTMAQHPVDNSIWLFSTKDAWSSVGVVHFTESPSGLNVNWTNGTFIGQSDGDYQPDPEKPDVVAAADSSTGTIALAYQSKVRKMFSTSSGTVTGSYPAVARIKADGSKTFTQLPIYVERISQLGLVVRPGEIWLAYQPIDEATLTYNKLYVSHHTAGIWHEPVLLGTNRHHVVYGASRPEFAANLTDEKLHFFRFVLNSSTDKQVPNVILTNPANGSTVSGIVNVAATASDNIGVTKVEFYVDGALVNTDFAEPYGFAWDTTKLPTGTHTISARAYDAAGNVSSSYQVNVTVQSTAVPPPSGDTIAPVVTIKSPADGSVVSGRVSIVAVATDDVAVTKMELLVNGGIIKTSSSGSISARWDTRKVSSGSHTITVKAYDAKGNVGTAQVVVRK